MSDQTPDPPDWRANVQTAGQASSVGKFAIAAAVAVAVLALGWTQMQRGAQNEQDLIDSLPGFIARLESVEIQLGTENSTLDQLRVDISELRTGLALTPDQGQVDRRDNEQSAARVDLEADVDRELDTLRELLGEMESDLEIAERELADLWRAVGQLEGALGNG